MDEFGQYRRRLWSMPRQAGQAAEHHMCLLEPDLSEALVGGWSLI